MECEPEQPDGLGPKPPEADLPLTSSAGDIYVG
jgi:hypothetical protein